MEENKKVSILKENNKIKHELQVIYIETIYFCQFVSYCLFL
jgi:hypothetical protein